MVRANLAVLLAAVLSLAAAVACEAQFLSDSQGVTDWERGGVAHDRIQGFYVNPG